MKVKCNKCGYIAEETEFAKRRDFLQNPYIAACPKCDNYQSPGGASLRMMPGEPHPFVYVRGEQKSTDPLDIVLHNAGEAS